MKMPGWSHACFAIAGAGLLLVCVAIPSPCQNQQPSRNMPFNVSGKIGKASQGKFQLDTGGNVFFIVRYSSATRITRANGSAGSSSDLQTGAEVEVKGDLAENGDILAKSIQLQPLHKKKPAGK
jgi:hypothetical protein